MATNIPHGDFVQAQLNGLTEIYNADSLHEAPCLGLFGRPMVVDKNQQIIDVLEHVRLVGTFATDWEAGKQETLRKFAQKVSTHAFLNRTENVTEDQYRDLRMLGSKDLSAMARNSAAAIARNTIDYFRFFNRSLEVVACRILSGATFDIDYGHATENFSWGITEIDESATPWTGAAINLVQKLEEQGRLFAKQFGMQHNLLILPDTFFEEVIAENTQMKAIAEQFPELYNYRFPADLANVANQQLQRFGGARFQVLVSSVQKDDGAGTLTNLWPSNKITLAHVAPGQGTLGRTTLRSSNNSNRGGFGTYIFQSYNPMTKTQVFNSADALVVKNEKAVRPVKFKA